MTIGLTNGGGTMTTNNAENINPEQEPIPQHLANPTASRRRAWFNIFITYSTKHFLLELVVAAKEHEVPESRLPSATIIAASWFLFMHSFKI